MYHDFPRQKLTSCNVAHFISSKTSEKRRRAFPKNRWVSTERDDGTAMGAIYDWSIAILGKPFFFLSHVQSVDKGHHPTDSLINCEIYSYLPPSYSHGPKTAPLPASSAFPPLDVCKERKQTGNHEDSLREKETAHLADFLFRTVYDFPIISSSTQPCLFICWERDNSKQRHRTKKDCQLLWLGFTLWRPTEELSTLRYTQTHVQCICYWKV